MVTARQPAGFRPSLPPAAASQEPRRSPAISCPLSAGTTALSSPGKLGDYIRLDNGHFEKKVWQWVQGGTTGQQPDTKEIRVLESEPWAQVQAFLLLLLHKS